MTAGCSLPALALPAWSRTPGSCRLKYSADWLPQPSAGVLGKDWGGHLPRSCRSVYKRTPSGPPVPAQSPS